MKEHNSCLKKIKGQYSIIFKHTRSQIFKKTHVIKNGVLS